jgi:hypothetical protein
LRYNLVKCMVFKIWRGWPDGGRFIKCLILNGYFFFLSSVDVTTWTAESRAGGGSPRFALFVAM